jgi:hypothetical protein
MEECATFRPHSEGHRARRPGRNCPLGWSLAAVPHAMGRLATAKDAPQAVAAATWAVWWITTTADAALNRRHPEACGHALAALDPAERRTVEASLAGLRFIRSQLGSNADPPSFAARTSPRRKPARLDLEPVLPAARPAPYDPRHQPVPGVPGTTCRPAGRRNAETDRRLPVPSARRLRHRGTPDRPGSRRIAAGSGSLPAAPQRAEPRDRRTSRLLNGSACPPREPLHPRRPAR